MIKQKISFHSPTPFTDDGVYLYKKEQVKRAILDLLLLNEYNFVPIYRPLPPILANNLCDVKYKDLVYLLHKIYNYCENYSDFPCLKPELGVKIDSFGVYDLNGRYVKVTFTTTDSPQMVVNNQLSLGNISSIVDAYFNDCAGLNTQGIVIISSL